MEGAAAGVTAMLPKVGRHCAIPVAAGGVRAAIVCSWDRHPPTSRLQPIIHSAPPVMHLPLKLYTFIKQSLAHEAPPSQAQGLPIPFKDAKRVQRSPRMTSKDNEVALDVPAMGITWRRLCSRSAWECGGRRRRSSGRRRTCW